MTETLRAGTLPGVITVEVEHASQVDRALDEAITHVKDTAILHRAGILITRTGPGRYKVRPHQEVPFGLIRQGFE
jgi:hypothetical protein